MPKTNNIQQSFTFKGFDKPEQNWFKLPNNWTDLTADITSLAELKIVEYILRHTWGYQEYGIQKNITIDEFMHGRKRQDGSRMDRGTGLSKPSVISGIQLALEHGFIHEEVDDSDRARIKKYYSLKMREEYSDVKNLDIGVNNFDSRGTKPLHRTEKETKERNLEKDIYISKDENGKQEDYVNNGNYRQPDVAETPPPALSTGTRKRGRPRKTVAGDGEEHDTSNNQKLEPSKRAKDLPPPAKQHLQPQQPTPTSEALQQYAGLGLSPAFIQQAVAAPSKRDEEWHDLKTFFTRGFSVELHDDANITSTVTRAYNLFKRKQEQHPAFDFGAFISLMYEAKSITQDRSGSITKKNEHGFKTKMAYFFAVLEDKLGFKKRATRAD